MSAQPTLATEVAAEPDLPAATRARQWIDEEVTAVRATPRRRYDGGGNPKEWNAAVERTVRVSGKAEPDACVRRRCTQRHRNLGAPQLEVFVIRSCARGTTRCAGLRFARRSGCFKFSSASSRRDNISIQLRDPE